MTKLIIKLLIVSTFVLFSFYLIAEDGFSRAGAEKCNLITSQNSFYWKYSEADQWILVDNFTENFQISPENELLDQIQKVDCFEVWKLYWKYNSIFAIEDFSVDFGRISKAVFSLDNQATGFFISNNGFFLTNYHVAKVFCDIPEDGNFDDKIKCKNGYILYAYPQESKYFGYHDYVLMKKTDVTNSSFLKISIELPKKGDRIFAAGFPLRTYDDKWELIHLEKLRNTQRYPVVNSGRNSIVSFFSWDPLVFSTGRISSLQVPKQFPTRCLGCDPAIISIRSKREFSEDIIEKEDILNSLITPKKLVSYDIAGGPGSSGSPLVNLKSEAVAIWHRTGIATSLISTFTQLDLCNMNQSKNAEKSALAKFLNDNNNNICYQIKSFCQTNECTNSMHREKVGLEWIKLVMKKNKVPFTVKSN